MITALISLALAAPAHDHCTYDREVELARDAVAFDQTEGQGWRPLHAAGCYVEAAELLRDWQAENADALDLTNPREANLANIMVWHEAQMWAAAGHTDTALPLFGTTYREGEDVFAQSWNLYVAGTIAFLNRDRAALDAAIAELSAIPEPQGWGNAVDQNGRPITMAWPQNLSVLEGLARCWDEGYAVAYVC